MATHPAVSKFILLILFLPIDAALGQGQNNCRVMSFSDATSAPLEGVSVLLNSLDRVYQTKSNTEGRFRFENVRTGSYVLELLSPGFVKQTFPVDVSPNSSQSFAIVLKVGSMPDMNYRGPNASIAYGSPADTETQLEGVIRDYYDHKPVAKVEVTIWRAGKKVSMRRSDQAGKFAFTGLSAGHYDLRVLGSGYGLESVKGLLLPRENSVFVEVPILQRNKIIVCQ